MLHDAYLWLTERKELSLKNTYSEKKKEIWNPPPKWNPKTEPWHTPVRSDRFFNLTALLSKVLSSALLGLIYLKIQQPNSSLHEGYQANGFH